MTDYDKIPKDSESYWLNALELPDFPTLEEDMQVDIAIVGGGITGITSAYLLTIKGYKVALLEADKLLHGTTGHTTAKVAAQHGLIYDELIQNMGKDKAKAYYHANIEASQFIQKVLKEEQIDCDFTKQDAYIYATMDESVAKLKKEADAYDKLGIEGELVDEIPIKNLEVKKGLVMKDQAQFHPTKYLSQLVRALVDNGGLVFENTTAVNVKKNNHPTVITRDGQEVQAKYILSCTHFPFYEGTGLYSARMHASRSYVLAAKPKTDFPEGMYINVEQPARSIRSVEINGEEMVLIVGDDHKTGQGGDTMQHYHALEKFGEQVFGLEEIAYRWSAQDLETLDKIPYIGNITSDEPHILVATGFRKWGMTNGTAAALLLTDIVTGKNSPYKDLYTPSRFHATPSLKKVITDNADVVGQLVKGKLKPAEKTIKQLSNDEGAVITVNGEKKGAYKDEHGKVYVVDTTCTHVGCETEWNKGERTWDCPCHGSRFAYTGEVLEGPAEKPLKTYDYHMIDNLLSKDSGY